MAKKLGFKKYFGLCLFLFQSLSLAAIPVDPRPIFKSVESTWTPSPMWGLIKIPYPTNAWFLNFVLDTQEATSDPVNLFPYLAVLSNQGISLSYTAPFFYAEPMYPNIISAFFYAFTDQVRLGPVEAMATRYATGYSGIHLTMHWDNQQHQSITAPLMQGSPYLTMFFDQATPEVSTRFKILSVNSQTVNQPIKTSNRYEIVIALMPNQTQTWILYTEKPISLLWDSTPRGDKLTASKPYQGFVRIALQKDTATNLMNDAQILDNYSHTIPYAYKRRINTRKKGIGYTLEWATQNGQPPLMLDLPIHRGMLEPSTTHVQGLSYFGIKGQMLGITEKKWVMEIPTPQLVFLEKKNLSPDQEKQIRSALISDAQHLLTTKFPVDGPYRTGKRLARAARLILIANRLGEEGLRDKMILRMESILSKHMQGKKPWKLVYDTTWGGIVPNKDDYGAQHYNDHHFHYGYWVYSYAVIAKFDPSWMTTTLKDENFSPEQWINILIRDYANPSAHDPYFPLQRYQDDFAGHSWASGLTASKDGQNANSSSEAVNAYYAIALYAEAMNDFNLHRWGRFLTGRELIAAKMYWQVIPNQSIYDKKFTQNNWIVASLWGSKIDANAFFKNCGLEYRCGLEYSFGIEMLPLTAITTELLDKQWLKEAYPTIKEISDNVHGKITSAWKWILIKGIADVMSHDEKAHYFEMATHSSPEDYDNGDSKTNTLYFLTN